MPSLNNTTSLSQCVACVTEIRLPTSVRFILTDHTVFACRSMPAFQEKRSAILRQRNEAKADTG
jgi:hypothetical protein